MVLVGPGSFADHVPVWVRSPGPISRKELRDRYRASDIFGFAAVGEPLALAMQEAMACGLPAVGCGQRAEDEWRALNYAQRRPGLKRTGQPYTDQEPRTRRWWPILTPIAVLAVGASLLSPAGRHQWALSLFRQPTHYTALSFSHASALPATAHVNEPITVSFMVGNHEGHVVHYRYVLSTSGDGRSRILGAAERAVAAGATWTVSAVVRPRCDISRCRIKVSLPGHPETIDFLITIRTPGA